MENLTDIVICYCHGFSESYADMCWVYKKIIDESKQIITNLMSKKNIFEPLLVHEIFTYIYGKNF